MVAINNINISDASCRLFSVCHSCCSWQFLLFVYSCTPEFKCFCCIQKLIVGRSTPSVYWSFRSYQVFFPLWNYKKKQIEIEIYLPWKHIAIYNWSNRVHSSHKRIFGYRFEFHSVRFFFSLSYSIGLSTKIHSCIRTLSNVKNVRPT